ncbi:hypothetical protein BpHYR1_023018 [Brachionus plicatilis]|uniref:Uncharacterized protein n=1 Tax=Brachionus plicatilis TaxID=10195 RepID=A0A3M7QFD5_BRAPC|nr:hypothetical protein BpHYR1_023018 [Brachionus plicatilis]
MIHVNILSHEEYFSILKLCLVVFSFDLLNADMLRKFRFLIYPVSKTPEDSNNNYTLNYRPIKRSNVQTVLNESLYHSKVAQLKI